MTAKSKERRRREEADLRRRTVAALVLHEMTRMVELWNEGLSRAEIAGRLGVSEWTVYKRLRALRRIDERGHGGQHQEERNG